jgi:hypothetical protein
MDVVSFKLPVALRYRLAEEARRRRVSQSTVIRSTLEAALLEQPTARGELTCADLAGELVGAIRGPRTLSVDRRHLDRAIASDAARGKKRRR